MSVDLEVERLLWWRLERAELDAPPAPSARRLLELARPWWERWPDRFAGYVARLQEMRPVYAHAASDAKQASGPYPVPVLLVRTTEALEASARVLYLSVRDGQLRLRFRLDTEGLVAEPRFDVTFVGDDAAQPLLAATAILSVEMEYHLEAELPEALELRWAGLRVTEQMPFRLILHPDTGAG